MSEWISVEDSLPGVGYYLYLVGCILDDIPVARFDGKTWTYGFDDGEIDGVTHWMELPDPPQEESND